MRIAAIDIGTNSVRLLKAEINEKILRVGNKKIASTRIGRGIGIDGNGRKTLSSASMKVTADVLQEWSAELEKWAVDEVSVIATSAVRDACNKDEFIDMVRNTSGLHVEVISGEMEAELGFLGVMLEQNNDDICMIIDVGGGSTELIVGSNAKGILYACSLDIGAVRMSEKFSENKIMDDENKQKFKKFVSDELKMYQNNLCNELLKTQNSNSKNSLRDIVGINKLIGIGGTATSFAAMDLKMLQYDRKNIQGYIIDKDKFSSMQENLYSLDIIERQKIDGLQPQRADIIHAGGQIIYSAIEQFGFENIITSDFDNLEGILSQKYSGKFDKIVVDETIDLKL